MEITAARREEDGLQSTRKIGDFMRIKGANNNMEDINSQCLN